MQPAQGGSIDLTMLVFAIISISLVISGFTRLKRRTWKGGLIRIGIGIALLLGVSVAEFGPEAVIQWFSEFFGGLRS